MVYKMISPDFRVAQALRNDLVTNRRGYKTARSVSSVKTCFDSFSSACYVDPFLTELKLQRSKKFRVAWERNGRVASEFGYRAFSFCILSPSFH